MVIVRKVVRNRWVRKCKYTTIPAPQKKSCLQLFFLDEFSRSKFERISTIKIVF
jgi:hypothetical protein